MPLPELTGARGEPLELHPIRTREGASTLSAWRLVVSSPRGAGAIVLVEASPERTFYRGEGIFLGWDQERLAEAYRALLPEPAGADPEFAQLG